MNKKDDEMNVIEIKSMYVNPKTGKGTISMNYPAFLGFKEGKYNYLVVDAKTNKGVRILTFKQIESHIYMYRFKNKNNEIKHTPDRNHISGEIMCKFMVCKF